MKRIFLFALIAGLTFSQTYDAGDIISDDHQDQAFETCYGEYPNGQFMLADLNGALNGGQYHIIFIDMAASW